MAFEVPSRGETKVRLSCHTVTLFASAPDHIDAARLAAERCDLRCELQILADVDAALAWLSRTAYESLPCLVLMDLQLPKLDSWALLRKIRLNPHTTDLPVLVYSSRYTQADVLLSYQAGANSFIAKPNNTAEFLQIYGRQMDYWLSAVRQQSAYTRI